MTHNDFKRIPVLRKYMAEELLKVETAHEQATNITSHLTGMPRGGSTGSMIENAVIRAEIHYEKYCELCEELHEIFSRLTKEYIKLNREELRVIDLFYPKGRKIGEIAKEMEITERHVFRLKKEAIEKLCSNFLS